MGSPAERWVRIFGFGLIVWAITLLGELALAPIEILSIQWYSTAMWLINIMVVLIALVLYLPGAYWNMRAEGWIIGSIWMVMNIACDGAFHFFTSKSFSLMSYLANDSWTFIYILMAAVAAGYLGHAVEEQHVPGPIRPPSFHVH